MRARISPLRITPALLALLFAGVACDGCDPRAFEEDAGLLADAGDTLDDAGDTLDDAGDTLDDAGDTPDDAGDPPDDAGTPLSDAGDGSADAGPAPDDAGDALDDAGEPLDDAGGPLGDAGDGSVDAGPTGYDAGPSLDSGVPPPTGACVSGASGSYAARFRWNGTTSGSTAWVSYETNTLPDTSRWKAGAYSQSIGYTPVFRDPFLGEGGLELSGTVFIDVELSTAGLPPLQRATLAIYGRSYNTTASGSFSWQTFSGMGATPSGLVSNSAPYEWYLAEVTTALPAGDDGTLLRIRAGPPSGALIVNRVEICFDTD